MSFYCDDNPLFLKVETPFFIFPQGGKDVSRNKAPSPLGEGWEGGKQKKLEH